VVLSRPEVRNAFDAELILRLRDAFLELGKDSEVRLICLSGEGKVFCGGADVNWMRASLELTAEQNWEDAQRMAEMYRAVDECPKFVVGLVHGAAMGGGAGLVAACDYVVAASGTILAFSEVKLGIIPAVISSFVLPKIGAGPARFYFLTGATFDAAVARSLGLVQEIVDDWIPEEIDPVIRRLRDLVLAAGPHAVAEAKTLLRAVSRLGREEALRHCVDTIARIRTSSEAQEGLRAFLEKRKPAWSTSGPS